MLIPPYRFGIVADGVYRSALPSQRNVPFLNLRQVHTIISLTPDPLNVCRSCITESLSCKFVHFQVTKKKEDTKIPLTHEQITTILKLIMDKSSHPTLVHCLDGKLIVSLVVMCFYKCQHWNLTAILRDAARFSCPLEHDQDIRIFVENYSFDEKTLDLHSELEIK